MSRTITAMLLTLAVTGSAWGQSSVSSPAEVVGTWQGTLEVRGTRLRLGLDVTRDSSGVLHAVMTSIDQGAGRIPAIIELQGDSVVTTMATAGARYAAVLSSAGDSLRGSFVQRASLPLVMTRVTTLDVPRRPQTPKPPFPYRTDTVSFESAPGVRLAGTLFIPAGRGPFPAAVLVTGSGPQDRDETMAGHKPFLVLADHLARHGIATLRYDDRGFGSSSGKFDAATSADFATDAEAAVHFLRSRALVARGRIGILGHSEGGLIAPLVASRSAEVAFVVLLAGPGMPGAKLAVLQTRSMLVAARADSATVTRAVRFNTRVYELAMLPIDSATLMSRLLGETETFFASLPREAQTAQVRAILQQASSRAASPWFRYFLAYDPAPALRRLRVPVLALNGTLDSQVPFDENLGAIRLALEAGKHRDHTLVALPELNHLFQPAKSGALSEYAKIDETIAPAALAAIVAWINDRFGTR
ncbi:MAG: alpha/beta fold hydrolase [Gemmatimonadaceae bacterium]|nr:alpha/beta fold hydrolase [Gemmatimonadaceae bacterium]